MYDALTSERVYKKAFPHDLAVRMIVEQKGKHFAPKIVEVFESAAEQFDEIRVAFWGDINEPASAMTAHGR
jgi:putative two-component system response regulator